MSLEEFDQLVIAGLARPSEWKEGAWRYSVKEWAVIKTNEPFEIATLERMWHSS